MTGYLTTSAAESTYATQTSLSTVSSNVSTLTSNLNNDSYGFWYYPWLSGWVHGDGSTAVMSGTYVNNTGGSVTVTRNNTGNYTVSWGASKNPLYAMVTSYWAHSNNTNNIAALTIWGSTYITVQIKSITSGAAVDGDFIFMIMA